MNDSQDREEWRRERSLLALGRAMRGDDDAPPSLSLLSIAGTDSVQQRMDARARHGLARERREAERATVAPDATLRPWLASWPDGDEQPRGEPDEPRAPFKAALAPRTPVRRTPRRRWPSWRLAAATTVLGACMGVAVAFSLPARYQATAELTLGGEAAGRMADGAIESQLRVLTSGMVLTKVVDRLNLIDDPEFNGEGGSAGLAGLLHAILMRGDAAADDGHRQALAVDHLTGTLSVAPGGPGLVAVTATTGNGEKSALIANAVADAFVEVYDQSRSGAAANGNKAADAGAADAAPLAAAQRRLNGFAVAHGLGNLANAPERVDEILQLDEDLAKARSRTESLNAKVASLRAVGIDAAAAGLPREFETGAIEALRAQYLDLKQQADSAAVKLGPRNPERRGIEAQLAGARDRLSTELRRIVAVQQAALKQAVETEQGYAVRLAKTGLTDEGVAALRALQREAAVAGIDRQTVTASVPGNASAASGQGAHVVSRAEIPAQSSGPSRTLLTLTGAMLGLFAGLGIGVFRQGTDGEAETGPDLPAADETGFEAIDDRRSGAGDWRDAGYQSDDFAPVDAAVPPPWRLDDASLPAGQPAALPLSQSGSSDSAAIPDPMETVMYPVYPDQHTAPAHPQQPQWLQPADYPPYPPQPFAQAAPQYYPPSYPPQHAYPQAWQPAPPYPYAHPMQAYPGPFYPPQPAFAPPMQDAGPGQAIDRGALDEIRASLHEFREALRELAETRTRRRIF
jgi:uncharacterized protein involved in exopolysaccharide biosynthesis